MKKFLTLAAVLALAGCGNDYEDTFDGPTGDKVHFVKCSQSSGKCFKKAAAVCRGKYAAISSSSNAGGLVADIVPGPVMWYRMNYVCGRSGPMPQFPLKGQAPRAVPIYVPPASQAPAPSPAPVRNCTTRRNGAHIQTTCM